MLSVEIRITEVIDAIKKQTKRFFIECYDTWDDDKFLFSVLSFVILVLIAMVIAAIVLVLRALIVAPLATSITLLVISIIVGIVYSCVRLGKYYSNQPK